MEKSSKEASMSETLADSYPEELKESCAAAFLLSSMKYLKTDDATAFQLRDMKAKILDGIGAIPVAENQQELLEAAGNLPGLPQLGLPVFDWKPPAVPPVQSLNGLIGRCSTPFEKQLTDSDVRDDQNRLALNKKDVENYLIPLLNTEEEKNLKNGKVGLAVTTYDSEGNEYPMTFKIWVEKAPVLIGGWKKFFHDRSLRAIEDFVSVWMFRHLRTEKLCFVITSRRLPVYEPIKRPKNK